MGYTRKKRKQTNRAIFTLFMNLWFDDDPHLAYQAGTLWRHGHYRCYTMTHLIGIALDYGRHHKELLGFFLRQTKINDRVINIAIAWLQEQPEMAKQKDLILWG